MSLTHPYAPEVRWRIAVSRRFSDSRANDIYHRLILPAFSKEDILLECRSASEDIASAEDFWTRRMRLIIEISDIVLLVDVGSNPNVDFEFDAARRQRFKGKASIVMTTFGWSSLMTSPLFHPTLVFVREGMKDDAFSRLKRQSTVYLRDERGDFMGRLSECVDRAKRVRMESFLKWERRRAFLWRVCYSKLTGVEGKLPYESAEELYAKCTELASHIAVGEEIEALRVSLGRKNQSRGASASPLVSEVGMKQSLRVGNEIDAWMLKLRSGDSELPQGFVASHRLVRKTIRDHLVQKGFLGYKLTQSAVESRSFRSLLFVYSFFAVAKARRLQKGR